MVAKRSATFATSSESLGLEPGGLDGTFLQTVPLIRTQVGTPATLRFGIGEVTQTLEQQIDIEVSTVRASESVAIDAPVVFVGFGAYAPERDWDDYGDIDLHGKVALYLVNDPDFAAGPDEVVAGRFGNRRMTYYGRWAYKFAEAARRGAAAALVIHETEAAGYGWSVASSSPGQNYAVVGASADAEPVMLQGWLHGEAAASLFAAAGHDLDELRVRARSPEFAAFEIDGVTFGANLTVAVENIESSNVLARLPGTTRPDETLMVSSHWDAYGLGEPDAAGRTVRPGANDDALGTAGVLEIARVLAAGPPLARSVVFAAWTAEESGLLGSEAYANDPIYPLEKTVANFTLDILQTAGPARDVILVGEGQSELEDDLATRGGDAGAICHAREPARERTVLPRRPLLAGAARRARVAHHGHCGRRGPGRRRTGRGQSVDRELRRQLLSPDLRQLERGLGPKGCGRGHRAVPPHHRRPRQLSALARMEGGLGIQGDTRAKRRQTAISGQRLARCG